MDFKPFPKIPRLNREIVITEKIDGTNALIAVVPEHEAGCGVIYHNGYFLFAGSHNRWITPADDNYGFARWVYDHAEELIEGLGEGYHYGEWWGQGIQRRYGLNHKRFSLFNVGRWTPDGKTPRAPACCHVVPVLWRGAFETRSISAVLRSLQSGGSHAAPSFMFPEGIVVYHTTSGRSFKVSLEGDQAPKGLA